MNHECIKLSTDTSLSLSVCSYKFHRGVDVRIDHYSNVYAVANGTVRIAGSHSGYSSNIVQV